MPLNSASDNSVRFQETPSPCLVSDKVLGECLVAAEILKMPRTEELVICFLRTTEQPSTLTAEMAVCIFIFPLIRQNFEVSWA